MTNSSKPPVALTERHVKVLLIDDQPIVGETVRRALQGEPDIVFHYCQDPKEALRVANEISPTVILQDLVMPDVDGLTLVKFFRAHPNLNDIPLIVLSSREEPVTKAEAFALGANDYLVKLPDRIELIARIRHHSQGYINLLERNEAYQALLKSEQRLAFEVARAAEYVTSLLPAPLPEGRVRTDWRYIPSAELGGDSFGYHWIAPDRCAIYLLDVSGHGVGAALLSVSALEAIRGQSLPNTDFNEPSQVLSAMNDAFQMRNHNNLYFTCWYGVYDAETRVLRYSSGGHPPALLISPDGSVQRLLTPNPIIGAFPKLAACTGSARVEPGARLYVFSDGVYEVENPDGEMWDLDGLEGFLVGAPENELDALHAYVRKMRGSDVLEDDFSLVRIEFP
jgi:sigma-B regulation protein RsbU (phosphoserine phosphatase)